MTSVDPGAFRFVTHELIDLSRKPRPDEKSWQAVKQVILKAASILRQAAGEFAPPIALHNIERLRLIRQKIVFDTDEASGAILIPASGGFILRLGKRQTSVRRRFGIAHEIGHTFFYDLDCDPPRRLFPRETFHLLGERKEEDICNAFARELLMPVEIIQGDIGNFSNRNLQVIIELATKYLVSPEVAARRLILDLGEFQSSLLIFRDARVTQGKNVWWFYGGKLRKYLRTEEKRIVQHLIKAVQDGVEPDRFANSFASPSQVLVENYQPTPNSRLMILVTFPRNDQHNEYSSITI